MPISFYFNKSGKIKLIAIAYQQLLVASKQMYKVKPKCNQAKNII